MVEVLAGSGGGVPGLQEGLYVAGAGGSTGAAGALAVMSVVSFSALAASAALIRPPPPDYSEDTAGDLLLSPLFSELTSRDRKGGKGVAKPSESSVDELEGNFFTAIK